MTNVAPDGTVKVEPDCTVNGPATSALSLAAVLNSVLMSARFDILR